VTLGVVVITADRDTHLERVLDGLVAQTVRPDRVVVVDMGSGAGSTARTPPSLPVAWVQLSGSTPGLALGAARNAGAARADCDHLAFLDVDCIPDRRFVADVGAALADHPGALVCGQVRYLAEGWLDAWPSRPLDELGAAHPARPARARDELDTEHHELFWSLNFAVTATTWAALGGFDTGYHGYGAEDTDLGLRARDLGIPLLWARGALVHHQWHPPTRLDPARTGEIVANAHRFHARWGTWPMRGWLDELDAAGAVRFDPSADRLEVTA
jgi:N-acetylglucosaminyl-diphospho-decaprenol L-rhamnosyltransferase